MKADAARTSRQSLTRESVVLVVVVCAASLASNLPRLLGVPALNAWLPPFRANYDGNMVDHLGGEYRHIAVSLASGRGYADPFGEHTGPTAWMPPILPLLQAALISALGAIKAAAVCVVLLQNLALIVTGWVVMDAARRTTTRANGPAVALGIYVAGMIYHFHSCFQRTHDSWLILLSLSMMFFAVCRLWGRALSFSESLLWGAFGGFAALTGPVLAFVWGVVTLACAPTWRTRALARAFLIAALIVSPWIARNAVTFHRFIPIKSNLYFELYQSNVLEPDGILRDVTFRSKHPYKINGPERRAYQEKGEMLYLDGYRTRFLDYLRHQPVDYLSKVGNRFLAATLIYYPHSDLERGITLFISYIVHPFPFYGLILLLYLEGQRLDRQKLLAIIIYTSYLVPYVLVAYYERYGFPLLGMKCLFCYWGWNAACERLAFRKRGAVTPV